MFWALPGPLQGRGGGLSSADTAFVRVAFGLRGEELPHLSHVPSCFALVTAFARVVSHPDCPFK